MDELVGSTEDLEQFSRSAPAERRSTPALKGILTEIAATGRLRYDWKLLQTLVAFYLDKVLLEYEAEGEIEVGPRRPLPGGETPAMLRQRLKSQLADQFPDEAPFTIQRLAELLMEPHKHYSRLDKLALALEKLINVTSVLSQSAVLPPRPKLTDLPPVNCNPRNPNASCSPEPRKREQPANEVRGVNGTAAQPGGTGDSGFGVASSVLAHSSRDLHSNRQGTPELEEALGHLNEAGVAARAAPHSPHRDQAASAPLSPPRSELSNGRQSQAGNDEAPHA